MKTPIPDRVTLEYAKLENLLAKCHAGLNWNVALSSAGLSIRDSRGNYYNEDLSNMVGAETYLLETVTSAFVSYVVDSLRESGIDAKASSDRVRWNDDSRYFESWVAYRNGRIDFEVGVDSFRGEGQERLDFEGDVFVRTFRFDSWPDRLAPSAISLLVADAFTKTQKLRGFLQPRGIGMSLEGRVERIGPFSVAIVGGIPTINGVSLEEAGRILSALIDFTQHRAAHVLVDVKPEHPLSTQLDLV